MKNEKLLTPSCYQFPISNYQLPIPNYQFPITNSQFPITDSRFSILYLTKFKPKNKAATVPATEISPLII